LDTKKPSILFADHLLNFIKNSDKEWFLEKWSCQEEWDKDQLTE
jgi:hypothetical protein